MVVITRNNHNQRQAISGEQEARGAQDFLANVAQVAREEAVRHVEDTRHCQAPRTDQEDPRNSFLEKQQRVWENYQQNLPPPRP
ncbi:uncharacterized protein G2W53_015481 [Senna tora]|uniref:Uncharacterized protein n=1 Tax=Senna tora TaxID=362788 RepID=A0A834WVK3_9FABA|nr:uncharacterized protein G2W53_015481 [Senna tora]